MKYRDSGIPEREFWESLLDVPLILDRFPFGPEMHQVAELGCGYGTFTVPLAARTGGIVHAFDIEPAMVEATRARAEAAGLTGVRVALRDVAAQGFGLPAASCDACLLFNILHGETPTVMLREAARILRPGGVVAVIHWRSDVPTPRGPALTIRPRAEQITAWAAEAGQLAPDGPAFPLPPWHFGITLLRTD